MCGIAFALGELPDEASSRVALASMAHRGPDDFSFLVDDGVWFGHTRLEILDLTEAASQPMCSPDGRYVLSYNGEIYNYRELRGELERAGWPLRGSGDTEVLLGQLALERERCLPRLRGMFAFALWDREERRLLAARDPLGIKPLLYAANGDCLVLASELRTLRALGVDGNISPRSVEDFLLTGSTQAPRTMIEGVGALNPGHLLRWVQGGLQVERWWEPSPREQVPDSVAELAEELDHRLAESVRIQLRSDVPVGSFLSGGIDSSLVTAYAAEAAEGRLRTFSVGFGDAGARWDETPAASLVAKRYSTEHSRIEIGRQEFVVQMEELPRAIDQPSVDGVNSWFICRAAAPHVTVCLSGQGGDELFGGYNVFRFASGIERLLARAPSPPAALARVGLASRRLPARLQHNWYLRGAAVAMARGDPGLAMELANPLFGPSEIGANRALEPGERNGDLVNELSLRLMQGYLPNTLLRDMDAMSMAHSLEVRVPIVDHRLAEFALAIPGSHKVSWQESKRPLREIARRRLPPELLSRPKQGFAFPLSEWLRHPDSMRILRATLAPTEVRDAGLVDPGLVRTELTRLERPRPGELAWLRAQRVWGLFVLHRWHRHWREGTL
jgi:asparagine synthase (glutamine-hydrolysing)